MTITVSNPGLVSVNAQGIDANGGSASPSFSPDGKSIIFTSSASNLVTGDFHDFEDIFVKDLTTGAVTLVSSSAAGVQGNSISLSGVFSPDGTHVMFSTFASNIVPGDTNNGEDIFLKDLSTGAITLVAQGVGNTIGNGYSTAQVFSGDGSKIAFSSYATNLGPHDANGTTDIYVRDLNTGVISLVSTGASGEGDSFSDRPSLNFDGTMVAFQSAATNLVTGDTNGFQDIFVKNLTTGAVTRILGAGGVQGNEDSGGVIFSPDGTHIAFYSAADNLVAGDTSGRVDIFLADLATGVVTRVSETAGGVGANGDSFGAVFSPDGHEIAFVSLTSNFGATDTNRTEDVYIKDLETGKLTLVSHNYAGVAGDNFSLSPSFSPDGTRIIYHSAADLTNTGGHNSSIYVATVSGNPHVISGTASNDTITGTAENDVIDGKGGKDHIHAGGGNDTVWAGTGNAHLYGGEGNDVLYGRGGNDGIYGENGNDYIKGGAGSDTLSGGAGNDTVAGEAGDDTVYGNAGDDRLSGGDGADNLYGASGSDTMDGGAGNDHLYGASGVDFMHGGAGDDVLYGDGSSDLLTGDDGNDELHGGSSADTLTGGAGNDTLYGDGASDVLFGEGGNDVLNGGTGTNRLVGGAGEDAFVINADSFDGHADKIQDFDAGEGDFLRLDSILSGFNPVSSAITDYVSAAESGGSTTIAIDRDGAGGAYAFENVVVLQHVTGVNIQDLYDANGIVVNGALA